MEADPSFAISAKAKPIAKWGRKATGLEIEFPTPACWIYQALLQDFGFKDSRAAEGDIVKRTLGGARLFLGFSKNRQRRQSITTGNPTCTYRMDAVCAETDFHLHEALDRQQPIRQRRCAMKKSILPLLVVFAFGVCAVSAQEKYAVSGTVCCVGTADVIISLSTHEEWERDIEPVFHLAIQLTDEQKTMGKVPFKFEGVPQGRYALLAFQDTDENGKLDRNAKGTPLEPTGTYRPSFLHLWSGTHFEVNQDIALPDIVLTSIID